MKFPQMTHAEAEVRIWLYGADRDIAHTDALLRLSRASDTADYEFMREWVTPGTRQRGPGSFVQFVLAGMPV